MQVIFCHLQVFQQQQLHQSGIDHITLLPEKVTHAYNYVFMYRSNATGWKDLPMHNRLQTYKLRQMQDIMLEKEANLRIKQQHVERQLHDTLVHVEQKDKPDQQAPLLNVESVDEMKAKEKQRLPTIQQRYAQFTKKLSALKYDSGGNEMNEKRFVADRKVVLPTIESGFSGSDVNAAIWTSDKAFSTSMSNKVIIATKGNTPLGLSKSREDTSTARLEMTTTGTLSKSDEGTTTTRLEMTTTAALSKSGKDASTARLEASRPASLAGQIPPLDLLCKPTVNSPHSLKPKEATISKAPSQPLSTGARNHLATNGHSDTGANKVSKTPHTLNNTSHGNTHKKVKPHQQVVPSEDVSVSSLLACGADDAVGQIHDLDITDKGMASHTVRSHHNSKRASKTKPQIHLKPLFGLR